MRRLALIPARGGSKRLPRKNILDFHGRPIIAWTIEAAKKTGLFERVVVSTEDAEISRIAGEYGADVMVRSPALASDQARILDVCLDFLDGEPCDTLCVLYATAPLRTASDIAATVSLIAPGKCDFALAATHYNLPVHQALVLHEEHKAVPLLPHLVNKRAADAGQIVCDNGSTYAVHTAALRQHKTFYGPNLKAHIMPRERSQDIDEELDLDLARFFATRQGIRQ